MGRRGEIGWRGQFALPGLSLDVGIQAAARGPGQSGSL